MTLAAAAGATLFDWLTAFGPHPLPEPEHTVLYVFAAVAALAAASDLSVIRRGGLTGVPRIARHLWRMSTALLIAAASFAGQPKAIPEFLRGSPITLLPAFAVLAAMIWWLVRVRLPARQTAHPGAFARMSGG